MGGVIVTEGTAAPRSRTRTTEERRMILARALQTQIGFQTRIESQADYQAVVVFGRPPNHLLHFFIGLFTFGAWWLVWLLLILTSREKKRMITVDEQGRVVSQDFN